MIFYDNTKKQGICQTVDRICDSDDTSYPLLDKRAELNIAGESFVADIINEDGDYQFDDSRYTDTPRGKGTLVEGQEAYTYASDFLQIIEVDILDVNGIWRRIKPLDAPNDLGGLSPEEYFGSTTSVTTKGFPEYYDLFADDSFRLYPAPTSTSVTLTNGYRVWFKRTFKIFDSTTLSDDYTLTPGIPSPYHYLLALMISLPYCAKYHKDRVSQIMFDIEKELKKAKAHYNLRDKDKRKIMTQRKIQHI